MVRETIVVVGGGENEAISHVIEAAGCNEIKTVAERAARAIKRFINEFGQGIPVAIVHEDHPDAASALARRLKNVCGSTRVIVMSARVGHPTCDADREYDVIVPYLENDLRNAMIAFLGMA